MTWHAQPICVGCKRFQSVVPWPKGDNPEAFCKAFPGGIPREIWTNQADHREPFKGDHHKQFVPVREKDAEYAELVFPEE